jgi:hypothetical protein
MLPAAARAAAIGARAKKPRPWAGLRMRLIYRERVPVVVRWLGVYFLADWPFFFR